MKEKWERMPNKVLSLISIHKCEKYLKNLFMATTKRKMGENSQPSQFLTPTHFYAQYRGKIFKQMTKKREMADKQIEVYIWQHLCVLRATSVHGATNTETLFRIQTKLCSIEYFTKAAWKFDISGIHVQRERQLPKCTVAYQTKLHDINYGIVD